jgi:hypothetical protein
MEIGQVFNPSGQFIGSFIPNCILKQKCLSSNDKLVWGRLTQYAGKDGVCYPKQIVIAEELGMAERSVRYSIEHLEKEGFIRILKPTGQDRFMHRNNEYIFLWHSAFNEAFTSGKVCRSAKAQFAAPTKEVHNKEVYKETKKLINTFPENPVERMCVSPSISPRRTRPKSYKLFNKIKTNLSNTRNESVVLAFLDSFEQNRNETHPPISDIQMKKGLDLIDEFICDLDDKDVYDVITQHFHKKLWLEQGLDFRFGLFISNLHMYTSERYK